MAIYQDITIACDKCEIEETAQPDLKTAVIKWRNGGGKCEDDGHDAICGDCIEEME